MNRFAPVGDSALLIELASEFTEEANRQVVALDQAINSAIGEGRVVGILETVPAYVSVLIVFDPLVTDHDAVRAAIDLLDTTGAAVVEPSRHHVAVCYDLGVAPDLETVAATSGLSPDGVVEAHLSGSYRVVMYGFAPGYAYLSGVPDSINVPRKQQSVRGVPTGSVIIAGGQCLITTIEMPTGWSVIGRTHFRVLPEQSSAPFAFRPGDEIVFDRITLDEYMATP
ncbi:MAG: allophanate hydrolase subunit 1 [Actinomycetota bacterium]|nr:allophanate hydrolase subunit 1 [Actinomycetota bacterium]